MTEATAAQASAQGFKGFAVRRPIAAFLTLVFGVNAVLMTAMLALDHLVGLGDAPLAPIFILAMVYVAMLPAALWVTRVADGKAAMWALLKRAVRIRFGLGWWLFVLALPVVTVAIAIAAGATFTPIDQDKALGFAMQIGSAVLIINLWEETVWAGFLQTRLERHFNIVVAAVLSGIPFALVHVPFLFLGDFSEQTVLPALGALVLFAPFARLLFALVMRGARDSLLAVGIVHALFNASNGKDGLADSLMDGVDPLYCALAAVIVLAAAGLYFARGNLARRA